MSTESQFIAMQNIRTEPTHIAAEAGYARFTRTRCSDLKRSASDLVDFTFTVKNNTKAPEVFFFFANRCELESSLKAPRGPSCFLTRTVGGGILNNPSLNKRNQILSAKNTRLFFFPFFNRQFKYTQHTQTGIQHWKQTCRSNSNRS